MGADIHGCVEVFLEGEWVRTLDIGDISPRNYELFSTFFGVRGDALYPYDNRGFPSDVAWRTKDAFCFECNGRGHDEAELEQRKRWVYYHPEEKNCQNCIDYHSLSYMTMQEIEQHQHVMQECIGNDIEWKLVFDTMRFFAEYVQPQTIVVESKAALSTHMSDGSRVRLIVWFDN